MKLDKELFPYFEKAGIKISYKPKDIIYMQEDDTQSLYLITKGRVRVFGMISSGKEVTFEVLEKGAIFGESSFFGNSLRSTTVAAVNEVELISCKLERLFPYLKQSEELTVFLLKMLAARCDRVAGLLKRSYFYDRYEKTASFLLDTAGKYSSCDKTGSRGDSPNSKTIYKNNEDSDDYKNILPYTHEEISTCVGLSRVVVTNVLNQFAKEGFIKNGYKKVIILDGEGLYKKYLSAKE